jgi:GNAT superfamily N-acetyltransferase
VTVPIRRATREDLSAFLHIHAQVHALHLERRPDQFKETDPAAVEARFQELLTSATAKVWLAELRGKVVGYAVEVQQQRAENTWSPIRRWCDIDQIGVDPLHRRQGVATALLQAVVDSAHAAGISEVELNSWAFNHEAHRAFESFGFAPKAIRFELKR